MEYTIKLTWAPDAGVWIATSDDIPSLVLESGSFDALQERVRFAVPELLALDQAQSPFDKSDISSAVATRHGETPYHVVPVNQKLSSISLLRMG